MGNKLTLIAIILLLVPGIPVLTDNTTAQGEMDLVNISVSHSPFVPVVGQTVEFQAVLQNIKNVQVTNVTLEINSTLIEDRIEMNMNSTTNYTYNTSFNNVEKIFYQVELFVDDQLETNSSVKSFVILGDVNDRANIDLSVGLPIEIGSGNYSISVDNRALELNFTSNGGLNITVTKTDRSQKPEGKVLLSDIYDININDTEVMENITLSFYYSETRLKQLGSLPDLLSVQKRDNSTSSWTTVSSTLIEEENRLEVYPTTFSEWTTTTSDANIKFLDTQTQFSSNVDSMINLKTKISNVGGVNAENVSIRIVKPQTLISANSSLLSRLQTIAPLENTTRNWIFSTSEPGEYNIIAILDANNTGGETIDIRIIVKDNSSTTNQSDNVRTPLYMYYVLFTGILLANTRRKK